MEKYYVAQLEELNRRHSSSKLVEVAFSRRPSTFGVLYTTEQDFPDGKHERSGREIWLKLATLSLTLDNKAKFTIVREAKLGEVSERGWQATKLGLVADFDTMSKGQLLIESSSSSNVQQTLQSSVFLLTRNGQLLAVTMIDCAAIEVTTFHADKKGLRPARSKAEHFLQLEVFKGRDTAKTTTSLDAPARTSFNVLALSNQRLYSCSITPGQTSNTLRDCAVHPNYQCSIGDKHAKIPSSDAFGSSELEFVRMLPMRQSKSSVEMVLLELSDGSLRILKEADCLACIPRQSPDPSQSMLLFPTVNSNEPNILLTLTRSLQLVAHTLTVDLDEKARADTPKDQEEILAVGRRQVSNEADPDGLIPEEPSFEMEQCWKVDLNEIDGVRSVFEDEEDQEADHDWRCFCLPIWSGPSNKRVGANLTAESDALSMTEMASWPRFLFVMCRQHVLIFNFEHANVLPFSIVYDRAFLNLTNCPPDSASALPKELPFQDKQIDLRLEPTLLHNFKLVGTRPSDSLFNMLFLNCNIRLVHAKNFNHLGLLVAISNMGHILVFKITSDKILGESYKDNLYQQLLIDSLRDNSLLCDELERMENLEGAIEDRTMALKGLLDAQNRGLHELADANQSLTDFEVEAHVESYIPKDDCFDLVITWPSLMLTVVRLIVVSNLEGSRLQAPVQAQHKDHSILNIKRTILGTSSDRKEESDQIPEHSSSNLDSQSKQNVHSQIVIEFNVESASKDQVESFHDEKVDTHSQRAQISLPFSVEDFKAGQLQIYLVTQSPEIYHKFEPEQPTLKQQFESHSFLQLNLPIKPLQSYQFVSQDDHFEFNLNSTISFKGPIGVGRVLSWLDQIIEIAGSLHLMNINNEKMMLTFKSERRSSSIKVEATVDSLSIDSEDYQASQLLKQHVLTQATNASIQLESGPLTASSLI